MWVKAQAEVIVVPLLIPMALSCPQAPQVPPQPVPPLATSAIAGSDQALGVCYSL